MLIFSHLAKLHRRPRTHMAATPPLSAGEAAVLDMVLPFNLRLYQIGVELGTARLADESTDTFAERLAAIITERQCTLERLLVRLGSKE